MGHKITIDGRTTDWAGLIAENDHILKLKSINAELLKALEQGECEHEWRDPNDDEYRCYLCKECNEALWNDDALVILNEHAELKRKLAVSVESDNTARVFNLQYLERADKAEAENAVLLEALEQALIVLEAPLDVFPRSYTRVMNACKEAIRKATP